MNCNLKYQTCDDGTIVIRLPKKLKPEQVQTLKAVLAPIKIFVNKCNETVFVMCSPSPFRIDNQS